MVKKRLNYRPPQTYEEADLTAALALCQASGSEYDPTDDLGGVEWTD